MPIITALPLSTYAPGTYNLGPATVPTTLTRAKIVFDMTHLTALTMVLSITVELSQDGGTNWDFAGGGGLDLPRAGYTLNAGVIKDSGGRTITESGIIIGLPNPGNSLRRIRATAVLSESFQTQVTFDLT